MRAAVAISVLAAASAIVIAFTGRPVDPPVGFELPAGFPEPPIPASNPVTKAGVELGRHLFYDTRLSRSGAVSCASCHLQSRAFSDPRARSIGATGEQTPRNAMSLGNSAYNANFDWAHPNVTSLEQQMLTPLFGEEPVEMGLTGHEERVLAELNADQVYQRLRRSYFDRSRRKLTWQDIPLAIADFERTLISANSDYDRYISGDPNAMSEPALRGLDLFVSEQLECFHCHGGFNFTDASTHDPAAEPPRLFHNNGLYNLDENGRYPGGNEGLYAQTGVPTDMGRFKAPTLRNIAKSAPYMHDGSIPTLDAVIDHYQRGGSLTTEGTLAGDGRDSPHKSEFVNGFELSDSERADLLAFLNSLSDEQFLQRPSLGNPW